jgi:Leucine-rich repeat (LRR) protein
LEAVPPAVWETGSFTMLDLSHNQIKELPMELSMCTSLEVLMLSGNKLSEWPATVLASLPVLQELSLAQNPIAEFPRGAFAAVPKLQVLDLSGVAVTLPPPPALSEMPHLQQLRLRRMWLKEFPDDLKSLLKLRTLDLSQNSITVIPEWVTCLVCLETLDLSDNDITLLPPKLGLLEPNLRHLKVDGNPLRSIRRPILERGTKALLQYLTDKIPA